MRSAFSILALSLAMAAWSGSGPTDSIDPTRPFLDKLRKEGEAKSTDFEFPFLISQTAVSLSAPSPEVIGRLRSFLQKSQLPIPSHFGKPTVSQRLVLASLPIPAIVKQGKQLEGINQCTKSNCLMKLNDQEKALMEASTQKQTTYHELVFERVKAYLSDEKLNGYEDRATNIDYEKQMLSQLPFFKANYPITEKFLQEGFWSHQKPPATFVSSFLRDEIVAIVLDRLQPIWRIGELLEFKENNATLFVEIHIYSNHYFDSSLRFYEVIPFAEKSFIVISDIIEIDELTKSGLIRMLYKGQMQDAVSKAETEELEKLK
jgi:hypothetical protein